VFRFSVLFLLCPCLWAGFVNAEAPVFSDVTVEAGLYALHGEIPDDLPLNGSTPEFYVGSAAVVDVDRDGWPDLHVARYGAPDRLYRNNRDGTFTDIASGTGLEAFTGGNGRAWADFDNDGDPDLFLNGLNTERHAYFVNQGDGTFLESALERGAAMAIDGRHHGMSVTFGDVNRDGWLDIFTTEWGIDLSGTEPAKHMVLLRNRGAEAPGFFENATRQSGLLIEGTSLPGEQYGYSAYLSDFDGNGWPDLGVIADFGNSQFFWNQGGGRFLESTDAARVGTDQNGMGGAVGDYDRDGDLDWFVTSIDGTFGDGLDGNRLYSFTGGRRFRDDTSSAGVRNGAWGWGAAFVDVDNDGDLDLIQTNGFMPGEPLPPEDPFSDRTLLWLNDGNGGFVEVGQEAGITDMARGQAVVVLDYDRDGDQDIFITNSYHTPVLYRNDTVSGHNWLRLQLEGTRSNRDAIGARVEIRAEPGGPVLMGELTPGNGYLSQHERILHFGLGAHTGTVHEVAIRWPSGQTMVLGNVPVNRVHAIVEVDDGSLSEPRILVQPEGVAVIRDSQAVLTVSATGNPEPVYQWYRNNEPIEGANGHRFTIERVRPFDEADYFVEVTNSLGSVRSDPVPLTYLPKETDASIARQWNELLLDAIRVDYPDPTVHARNLFHFSIAVRDAWLAFVPDSPQSPYLAHERVTATDVDSARREAISFAAYRILSSRYQLSPNHEYSQADFERKMRDLGYDADERSLLGDSPSAVGNRIAARVLSYGWRDGANEAEGYRDSTGYEAANEPLIFKLPGTNAVDPNRWQPLAFDFLVLQNGIPVGAALQEFLGLNWLHVTPFAIEHPQVGIPLDPGPPPFLGTKTDEEYKQSAVEVIRYSSFLDPGLDRTIDISPGAYYNNPLGSNEGTGYPENPVTGEPYAPNIVQHADYGRCIAEFWADGPDSETPPGHWNTIANDVSERIAAKRIGGAGRVLDDLEWDVHLYFALNGALHDAAVAAWAAKRHYDYVRPVTMIRYLSGKGQSSDPAGPAYHPEGIPLEAGLVEVVTEASSAPGERHAHLADYIGEVALYAWQGEPDDPDTGIGGVGWIRGDTWMPYQRFSFVSPPFAAYVSGHSTFSRAAAEVLSAITGSSTFPGGLMTYSFSKDTYLHFERGPSEDLTLTWATYADAADEAGLSRLYGGIHVRADDFKGRIMGAEVGQRAWEHASTFFSGDSETLDWEVPVVEFRETIRNAGSLPIQVDWTSPEAPRLRILIPVGLDLEGIRIEASADLRTWQTLSLETDIRSLEFLDHGLAVASFGFEGELDGSAFYRLVFSVPIQQ